ncbi:mycothiol transferase [Pseudokineococcus sp. 1T1Z-3]|uniref:mycothiol transferase n=1 Tax=Pseudokineococcus sp. 1T1Z-3 TaxID=3132745 RepID=UPI0030AF11B5
MTATHDPGPEREALMESLRDQRAHVLRAVEGLPEADLRRSVLPSGWTPLGLVRHLTWDVERFWFRVVVAGERLPMPTDEEVWQVPGSVTADDVVQAYRAAAALGDEVVAAAALDARPARWALEAFPGTPDRALRATVLHVVTETAAHAGHLDVVRELLDGHQHLVVTDGDQA